MVEEKPHHPTSTVGTAVTPSHVALIVGVTGITGLSLVESLRYPSSPGAPWIVYGAARRPPPPWFPLTTIHSFLQLDALDPTATFLTLAPLSHHVTHLFWVASTAAATPSDNAAMLSNVIQSLPNLRHVALQTGSMHYLPPLPAAGRHPATPAPFREDSPRGAHPLFYYALEDVLESYRTILTWTVHRPSAILGASARSEYNLVLTLAAYALICRREGGPLLYPGKDYTWRNLCCDASDAGLLAEQQIWAAAGNTMEGNEAFNCTNGDVFAWRSLWEVVAGEFGVGHLARGGEGWDWVVAMKGKGDVWDEIVEEKELVPTKLDEIANFEYLYAMTNLEFEMVSCMRKSRDFGFDRRVDTMESVKRWIGRLKEMNVIPKH
ncbi:hypothetical protein IEQ34_010360 [Dendrobium chrysotoxum]|uniref:PRISE-like Rossmann-fold domain-containing protein n=1 Tax=Dendrobium chrysotoxum TaxID=161865 RepID=A0AAV7H5I8_DENCH|nr:hypothetical protein IEQ34_010360 [Dendrobium chrysotoxum]